jgi:hypothetical protein
VGTQDLKEGLDYNLCVSRKSHERKSSRKLTKVTSQDDICCLYSPEVLSSGPGKGLISMTCLMQRDRAPCRKNLGMVID